MNLRGLPWWVAASAVLATGSSAAQCPEGLGDVTGDLAVNALDVQCAVIVALWELGGAESVPPGCAKGGVDASDMNCSGSVDVSDVVRLVHQVLGNPVPQSIDCNLNGCVDTCEPGPVTCACDVLDCNDGNPCTIDWCDSQGGCESVVAPNPAPASSGTCCQAGSCDDTACAACVMAIEPFCEFVWTKLCAAVTPDCTAVCTCDGYAGLPCSDGLACTSPDLCIEGSCEPGGVLPGDDPGCPIELVGESPSAAFDSAKLASFPAHSACGGLGADIWYTYQAPCDGVITAATCGSDLATVVAIYHGAPEPGEPPGVCRTTGCGQQAVADLCTTSGETYYVQVGGKEGLVGKGKLTLTHECHVPPPVPPFEEPPLDEFTPPPGPPHGCCNEAHMLLPCCQKLLGENPVLCAPVALVK